jgi:hypothetical protein
MKQPSSAPASGPTAHGSSRGSALKWWLAIGLLIVVAIAGYFGFQQWVSSTRPTDFPPGGAGDIQHFKYGSIGSDVRGLPYRIWQVLPEVFSDKLPAQGFASLGFVQESGQPLPIGFSKREGVIPLVGLNCAVCHTGTVREKPDGEAQVILAMPAQQLDLIAYLNFLFACAQDPRFTPETLIPAMEKHGPLNLVEKLVYPTAIERTREGLRTQQKALEYLQGRTPVGPGRVDTFGPYRTLFFRETILPDEPVGVVDFPAIWQQQILVDHYMHWDGNNNSIDERNLSAALGAGSSPESLDLPRIARVRAWIMPLPPPKWPFAEPPADKVELGKTVYQANCAECHDHANGAKFGQVTPLDLLQTDPDRVRSFNEALAAKMNNLGEGYPWRFKHFRTTNGYVNGPLTGIWARAPYLHNGSIPNLRTLLTPPENRSPSIIYRGSDLYDVVNVGFVSDQPEIGGRKLTPFDPTKAGNHNDGHDYGVRLSEPEKEALIEYLKTL